MAWGANTTDESKPSWRWLRKGLGQISKVYATKKGWVYKWPWGEEVIVAIGGLSTALGNSSISALQPLSRLVGLTAYFANTTSQNVRLAVLFNEPVTVQNGTPTLTLLANNVDTANVALSYISEESTPAEGYLVFGAAVDGSGYTPGRAVIANSSSTLSGWDKIVDAETANAVANAVAGTATFVVKQAVPVHIGTEPIVTEVVKAENAQINFWINFNQAVTVATPYPTIRAISNTESVANSTLVYDPVGSAPANGNLHFVSAETDWSALEANVLFTCNSTSTLANWSSIRNDIDGTPANALLVANTITVVTEEAG